MALMKTGLFVLFIICYNNAFTQYLSVAVGQFYNNTKTIVPILNQDRDVNNHSYFSVQFDYIVSNKYIIGLEYSRLPGWTNFDVDTGNTWGGNGSSRVDLHRFSSYFGYNILKNCEKVRLYPFLKVDIEKSEITAFTDEKEFVRSIEEMPGYRGNIYVEPFERWQILPSVGLNIDWNPIWKIYFVGNISYSYGYRTFQKFYFEYEFQGELQPTAEWHGNGTGFLASVGIGLKLW